jgi:predicted DNA-binding protein
MSTPDSSGRNGGVKTLAIRLEPELHAQLSMIAQLTGSTIADEIRGAIGTHIRAVKSSPDFAAKADQARAEIEREAAARRDAIATLFGDDTPSPTPGGSSPSTSGTRSRSRKGGDASSA